MQLRFRKSASPPRGESHPDPDPSPPRAREKASPAQPDGELPLFDQSQRAMDAIRLAHAELHERVSVPVTAPSRIRHSAYLLPDESASTRAKVHRAFHDVTRQLGVAPDTVREGERAGFLEKRLANGTLLRVVWELHTEFYSYTTIHVPGARGSAGDDVVEPFSLPSFPTLGSKLVDLDIMVCPGTRLTRAWRAGLMGGIKIGRAHV